MRNYLFTMIAAVLIAGVSALGVSALNPAPASAATNTVKRCGGGKIALNANEKRAFMLHNQTRKNRHLPVLCVHPRLQKAARAHSRDMLRRNYFSHGNTGARLKNNGYNWRTYGENIGYNQTNPNAMFRAWMNSSGHRTNILHRPFREVGIGAVPGNYKGSRVVMYTVDFGAR